MEYTTICIGTAMAFIDYFSDTNHEPTQAMRKHICYAQVGNEVAGEDPSVNQLIDFLCDLTGFEAGIFLPSGTMGNGIAYRVWCDKPGDSIIFSTHSHANTLTAGIVAGLVHATAREINCPRGIFTSKDIQSMIPDKSGRNIPNIQVISIEQTTNLGGGAIWPLESLQDITSYAQLRNIAIHIDGARLFNAIASTEISAKQYCQFADSLMLDFSKGLGAPLGAALLGNKDFIEKAWYYKFQQGGGMHQAGMMAAGCLFGLRHHQSQLVIDHENAKLLAHGLSQHPCICINTDSVETNIILFEIINTTLSNNQFIDLLKLKNIRMLAVNENIIRAITHRGITKKCVSKTIETVYKILDNHLIPE